MRRRLPALTLLAATLSVGLSAPSSWAAEPSEEPLADAASLDLDTLVVPAPKPPAPRNPREDIRRLLRPERSILERTETLDQDIDARSRRLTTLEGWEERLTADLERAKAEFERLTEARDRERLAVKRRLRTMIRIKEKAPSQIMLSASSYADFHGKKEALDRLYEADRRRVVRYRLQLAHWREAKADLARRRLNLANTQEAIAFTRQELSWDEEERHALEGAIRGEAEFYAEYVHELEDLDTLLHDKVLEVADPNRQRLYLAETKGRLSSPIRNPDIVGGFGIRTHPKFKIQATFHGVDMVPFRPRARNEVRAIYWGYIAWTGWLRGLGRVVIIDHTMGYASVYAHLAEIDVAVGTKVKTGEAIGVMGATGSFWGERLYLELRDHGKAINPMPWIR